jgi:hypothetical protein
MEAVVHRSAQGQARQDLIAGGELAADRVAGAVVVVFDLPGQPDVSALDGISPKVEIGGVVVAAVGAGVRRRGAGE